MDGVQVVILGIVEGLTEFLPISSTLHLILTGQLLGLSPANSNFQQFIIAIQAGAAIIIIPTAITTFRSTPRLIIPIAISFISTAIVAIGLQQFLPQLLATAGSILSAIMLFLGGVVLLVSHRLKPLGSPKPLAEVTIKDAVIIGLFQALAIIPGVSRALACIVACLVRGTSIKDAFTYSFVLAIPTILTASAVEGFGAVYSASSDLWVQIVFGALVSAISAYITTKTVLRVVSSQSLTLFGWYRIILAGLLLTIYLW